MWIIPQPCELTPLWSDLKANRCGGHHAAQPTALTDTRMDARTDGLTRAPAFSPSLHFFDERQPLPPPTVTPRRQEQAAANARGHHPERHGHQVRTWHTPKQHRETRHGRCRQAWAPCHVPWPVAPPASSCPPPPTRLLLPASSCPPPPAPTLLPPPSSLMHCLASLPISQAAAVPDRHEAARLGRLVPRGGGQHAGRDRGGLEVPRAEPVQARTVAGQPAGARGLPGRQDHEPRLHNLGRYPRARPCLRGSRARANPLAVRCACTLLRDRVGGPAGPGRKVPRGRTHL